jgi:membrane protein
MHDHSPLSPEERRKQFASMSAAFGRDVAEKLQKRAHWWDVIKRVVVGVYNDGFIHAGNLAYLALLALFPFFIFAAAFAQLLGQSESGRMTVADGPLAASAERRSRFSGRQLRKCSAPAPGTLLWIGAIVGLWTVGSFIETIRDILRRAYGVKYCAPFWHYRLASMAVIVGAVSCCSSLLRRAWS